MQEFVTKNLADQLGPTRLRLAIEAFKKMILLCPSERHFVLRFANANEGRGQEIWAIIDQYPAEEGGYRITYLLPSDY